MFARERSCRYFQRLVAYTPTLFRRFIYGADMTGPHWILYSARVPEIGAIFDRIVSVITARWLHWMQRDLAPGVNTHARRHFRQLIQMGMARCLAENR